MDPASMAATAAVKVADTVVYGALDRKTGKTITSGDNTRGKLIYEASKGSVSGVAGVVAKDAARNIFGTSESKQDYGTNGKELKVLGSPICPKCQTVRFSKGCDKGKVAFMKWICCRCEITDHHKSKFVACRMCNGEGGNSGFGRPPSAHKNFRAEDFASR